MPFRTNRLPATRRSTRLRVSEYRVKALLTRWLTTVGDGMGSRSGGRAWGIGDDSDPEIDTEVRPSARSRRQQEARAGAELDF